MNPTPPPAPPAAGSPLFRLCQALLADHESHLRAAYTALGGIRGLLASPQPESMAVAVDASQQAAQTLETLASNGRRFRTAAAALLHVEPETVTLSLVAARLPADERATVLAHRQRVKKLAAALDHANQVNAVVLWWCLDFIHQVLADLQTHPTGGRYTAAGTAQATAFGPTWHAQG